MREKTTVADLLSRYERLKSSVAALGLVQIGSIAKRIDQRRAPRGRLRRWGPYYQWTFKEGGKTRTVNLTAQQAREWAKAIRNQRRLEKIARDMRQVSLRILKETTTGVPPRKCKR